MKRKGKQQNREVSHQPLSFDPQSIREAIKGVKSKSEDFFSLQPHGYSCYYITPYLPSFLPSLSISVFPVPSLL